MRSRVPEPIEFHSFADLDASLDTAESEDKWYDVPVEELEPSRSRVVGRSCPDCGRELSSRRRYCYACAKKRHVLSSRDTRRSNRVS